MRRLIFDIETNGFLHVTDRVHCLVIADADNPVDRRSFSTLKGADPIEEGLRILMGADLLIGHNIIKFDLPVLRKLYPWFDFPDSRTLDTLVAVRVLYPDIGDKDAKLVRTGVLPSKFYGKHSLEAWGFRLGVLKDEYTAWCEKQGIADPWAECTARMVAYCEHDVEATAALLANVEGNLPAEDPEWLTLEHRVASIIARQERRGFSFDVQGALALVSKLKDRQMVLEAELAKAFPPRYLRDGKDVTPKKDSKQWGYSEGAPLTKVKLTEFNPGSRVHIETWLRRGRGWVPTEFTADGHAKLDETTMADLPWPEAKLLVEYLTVSKRLGQIFSGDEAWLKHERGGFIYGGVNSCGAVTGRMTHANPNLAQVPACSALYGKECRSLFRAREGYVLVGCDADALELRDLAGFMAYHDKGAYIETVLRGDKAAGTDMHTVNCRALGMEPKGTQWDGRPGREVAKTFFYAFIYGAGDEKLGYIITGKKGDTARKLGKTLRKRFLTNLPALGKLVEEVQKSAKAKGWLRGLDGRKVAARGLHAALNTLLQSAGAIQMKQALVILDTNLQEQGLVPGEDYEFVANVHDEWQIEVRPHLADYVGRHAADAIRLAGEHFKFDCPLAGNYEVGSTWADTH